VTAQAPYEDCVGHFLDVTTWFSFAAVIVGSSDFAANCPADGDPVTIVLDGDTDSAINAPFQPGTVVGSNLVAHGDSMRVVGELLSGATIGGAECAVILEPPPGAFLGPGTVTAFVLADEIRSGCGAPGRDVIFHREGKPLAPTLPWAAGRPDTFIEFTFVNDQPTPTPDPQQIEPPQTGTGPAVSSPEAPVLASLAAAVGAVLTICGYATRRRRADETND
jgi:hypothetical protein